MKLQSVSLTIICVLFVNISLFSMTLDEWKAYKQSDAYKKERAEIEARKERSKAFMGGQEENNPSVVLQEKKPFIYSYNVKQPPIASKRYIFDINGVKASIPYESNYALHQPNKNVKKLILAIHSSNHDAVMYYNNTLSLATKLHKEKEMLIVAPHLLVTSLISEPENADFLYWKIPPFRGSSGALYANKKVNLSAYEVLDTMIDTITRSKNFPNLKSIVIFGHSAGGQLINRYAAYSRFNKQGLHVRYIVMAPSSYVYFNKDRAVKGAQNRFAVPSVDSKEYNRWGFGMEKLYQVHRRNHVSADMMRQQYRNSEVIYFVGSKDNNPKDASLGKSRGSMWQGRHRVERAMIYYNYLQHYFGKAITHKQHLHVIPNVGHSSKGLMNSKIGREYLFSR